MTNKMNIFGGFNTFAKKTAHATGHPLIFVLAVATIAAWALCGPLFHFSDTWQLIINTGTTIITFLMVFLIQNTQNRDTEAIQIKLDELIRAMKGANNALINLEELDDEELKSLHYQYSRLASKTKSVLKKETTK